VIEPRHVSQPRFARFAAGVAERHTVAALRARAARRVFTRMPRLPVRLGGGRLLLAVSVGLRLESRAANTERLVVPRPRIATVIQAVPSTRSSAPIEPLVRRSAARATREDGRTARVQRIAAHVGRPTPEPAPSRAVVPPVRRVHRSAVVAVEQPPTAPARRDTWTPRPNTPTSLSATEIGRLTDHIVETIDRRIAAFRERRGRV
jgi:hypothetical protein